MLKRVLLVIGLVPAAAPVAAQQKLALTKPDAEFAEPYTSLRAVRELADGRVMVADVADKVVHILDFRSGTATKVGREGQGPEEYLLPMALFPTPDGGALLSDLGNRRFLPIGADGKVGKSVTVPTPSATSGNPAEGRRMMMGAGLFNPQASDAKGNLYFQAMALPDPDGKMADSVPLMRWMPGTSRIDTVTWLPITEAMRPQIQRDAGGRGTMFRMGGGAAWPKQVGWSVAPDGRIAIVTPEPYRVTWIDGTGRTTGPQVPYTPIKVTEADKKQYLDQMSRARPIIATMGGGGSRVAPPSAQNNLQDTQFPETKPAFSGNNSVLVTPEGDVWVNRLRLASEVTPLYDVFDDQGRKQGEVILRPKSRVVGFGKGTAYVVRSDDDDLQYLERYQRPARQLTAKD